MSLKADQVEVCLGHALKGVAGTYRQYGYLPEKARALQAWADELLPDLLKDVGEVIDRRRDEVFTKGALGCGD